MQKVQAVSTREALRLRYFRTLLHTNVKFKIRMAFDANVLIENSFRSVIVLKRKQVASTIHWKHL